MGQSSGGLYGHKAQKEADLLRALQLHGAVMEGVGGEAQ